MVRRNHNDDLTIREIEYSIHVKDKEKGFREVLDILRTELTRFEDSRKKNGIAPDPIREFLKTNIERSIVIRDSTRVYFLDYHDQGALSIQFKLLVITRYVNYGTTRQALDFLIKDTIGDYFEELLERHLPVSVTVNSADVELYDIPASVEHETGPIKTPKQRDTLSLVLASVALLATLAMCTVWLIRKPGGKEDQKPNDDYRDKYFELLIDKQVNDAIQKEKLNYILYKNLIPAPDSVQYMLPKRKK